MKSTEESICINLDILSSIEDIPSEPLIFQRQYETLIRKISRIAKKNIEEKMKQDIGSRACFFIDGTRGSGKSTLMRAVRKALTEATKPDIQELRIASLADIDPTELAKGENFFMYILGKILDRLEQQYQKNNYLNDKNTHFYDEALECIRNMSGGLRLIVDAEDSLLKSTDPEFFIEESVEKCASSSDLRKNLNTLLDKLCNLTGANLFLVTVDDADMNFSKCASILEYVRKYMHSPRLLFLFAGDMQLYAHVVRGMQMNNFEPKLFKYDNTHQEHRLKMLDRLEDQYLLKFFPVDNRVALNNFSELRTNDDKVILIRTKQNGEIEQQQLRELLEQKLSILTEDIYIPTFKNFLCKLPLRSVLSLLRLWKNSDELGDDTPHTIADGIQRVALQALLKHHIDYTELHNSNLPTLLKAILQHLTTPGIGRANPDLLPHSGDTDLLFGSFYLSALVSGRMQHHSSKLAYLCSLFPKWHIIELAHYHNESLEKQETVFQQMLQTALYPIQEYNALLWGAHATDCMALYTDQAPGTSLGYGFGTIRLLKNAQERKKEVGQVARISLFDFLKKLSDTAGIEHNKASDSQQKIHYAIAHSISCVTIGKATRYYLSIFNLIFLAAELLDITETGEKQRQKVKSTLTKNFLLRAVRQEGAQDAEDLTGFGSEDSIISNRAKIAQFLNHGLRGSIIDDICTWINRFSPVSYISTAKALQLCWNDFCLRCENKTAKFLPEFDDEANIPEAFTLFEQYMIAFEEAISEYLSADHLSDEEQARLNLSDCIRQFPLWEALKKGNDSTVIKALNNTNIITLKSKKFIQEYTDSKAHRDKALQIFNTLQTQKEQAESKFRGAQNALSIQERTLNALNSELTQLRLSNHDKEEQLQRVKESYNSANKKEKSAIEKTIIEETNLKVYTAQRRGLIIDALQSRGEYRKSLQKTQEYLKRKKLAAQELAAAEKALEDKGSTEHHLQRSFKRYTLTQELRVLETDLELSQTHAAKLLQSLQTSRRKAFELKQKILECARLLRNLRKQSEEAYKRRESLNIELNRLQSDFVQEQERMKELENKTQKIRKRFDTFKDDAERSQNEVDKLYKDIAEANAAYRAAEAQLNAITNAD